MSKGKQHSFATLFEDVTRVEIPLIQRDYAQGRHHAADIRMGFLAALREALTDEDSLAGLDLDFVYGSVEPDSGGVLSVLDGQQRLTTLFLLHWYLAAQDGQLDDFRKRWTENGRSRFTYATRPSSAEFFHGLVNADFSLSDNPEDQVSLSGFLIDCNWFFVAWNSDPTVQSCLVMLDAIDGAFCGDYGLYQRLIDPEQRRITFHYLHLHDFGLSDDLYVKMNARGKPLTSFENFKAWLVGRIGNAPWSTTFDANMDQKWIDFFWRLSREQMTGEDGGFDDLFLRFLYLMAFFEACSKLKGSFFFAGRQVQNWINRLRTARGYVSLKDFETHGAFDTNTLQLISKVLDYFSGPAAREDIAILELALSKQQDYVDLVKLYAVIAFVGSDATEDLNAQQWATSNAQWKRVTANLINNTRIDEPAIAAAVVNGLRSLSSDAAHLYHMLAASPPSGIGFSSSQILEESRKAALIIEDAFWEPVIIRAEAHPYLQGRVGFLLDFSQRGDGSLDQDLFEQYAIKAAGVLSTRILESDDFLLQRALLSLNDYLISRGSGKYSFCAPSATTFRHRSENWLRVVGTPGFKQLLDLIGANVAGSLRDVIDKASCSDWRKYIISDPNLIHYCQDHLLHRDGPSMIYLLSKSRLSGYFVELRSYALYLKMSSQRSREELPQVKEVKYDSVYGDALPALSITTDTVLKIRYEDSLWRCHANGDEVTMPTEIELFMQAAGFTA